MNSIIAIGILALAILAGPNNGHAGNVTTRHAPSQQRHTIATLAPPTLKVPMPSAKMTRHVQREN